VPLPVSTGVTPPQQGDDLAAAIVSPLPRRRAAADNAGMVDGWNRRRNFAVAALLLLGVAIVAALTLLAPPAAERDEGALFGEARQGGLTVALREAVGDVRVTQAKAPGRPIVLIDPGHGGVDPGAPGVSGQVREKDLTLVFSRELRDLLASRGRVRVAMTREDDRSLSLEQRAAIARKLGAGLLVSVHMDSAPNPLARGATVYSLSDVASDAEAARFARAENRQAGALTSEGDASVRFLLSDLALRDQMADSAALAARLVKGAGPGMLLRPEPHKFAAFHILRHSEVPGVLFEAGYISNPDDEALLITPAGRRPIIEALAKAIETELSLRMAR
jgi:N-acetylmuramoyl-L-alanine amidase